MAKPILERLLADVDTIQQVTRVQGSGLFERLRGVTRGQPFEPGDIDVERGPIEGQQFALNHQDLRRGAGEGAPEKAQALTEALSGLLLPRIAPEDPCQLASEVGLLRSYGEVSKKGLSLPRRERQPLLPESGVNPPEKPKRERRHSAFLDSVASASENRTIGLVAGSSHWQVP